MPYAVTTLLNTTETAPYTSTNISVGSYTELTCDIEILTLSDVGLFSFNRINAAGIVELIREYPIFRTGQFSFDLYHFDLTDGSDPYIFTAFGNMLQLVLSGTCSATLSLKGKGLA